MSFLPQFATGSPRQEDYRRFCIRLCVVLGVIFVIDLLLMFVTKAILL